MRAGVILARGMNNSPTSAELRDAYFQEQQDTISRIGDKPLSEIEALAAWRGAFREFGVNPTKYRCAPEALLRRLTKKGDIPSINSIVDICNLVSIKYAIAAASFDTRALSGGVSVRFADGSERYTPLGEKEVISPDQGEVIFVDDSGLVIARRWCWRQSQESASQIDTCDAIFTLEAQYTGCLPVVEAALNDLIGLLKKYIGGNYVYEILGKDQYAITG
jgi:DNA/RNA-binding domain of Phe-tRNA-synthetase-like protein